MRLRLCAAAAVLLALSLAARADTVTNFILTGALPDGSVSGTITIDTTTGLVTANNFTVIASSIAYLFNIGPEQQVQSSILTTNVSFYDAL